MIDLERIKVTDKHVFFWGGWPSNWYTSLFTAYYNGKKVTFYSSEQFFMFRKALYFEDFDSLKSILATGNPREAKEIGRRVKGFNDAEWDKVKYRIMFEAQYYKYAQNKDLQKELTSHKYDGKTFVEASPHDCIWGIGLSMNTTGVDDENNWRGKNLLGKAITEARKMFIETNDIVDNIKWE